MPRLPNLSSLPLRSLGALRRDPYLLVVSLVFFFGVLLRSLGYFDGSNGLWNDEANWVLRIASGNSGGGIRPPGYVLLSRLLIAWHPSEAVLRFSSYLAGVLALPFFYMITSRARLEKGSILFGLFVLAVHPWLISFAKEFKPYGLEFGLHVALLALTLSYVTSRSFALLLATGLVSLLSLLFAWNVVFLLPAIGGVLLATQVRHRLRSHWMLTGGTFAAGAIVVGTIHHSRILRLLSSRGPTSQKFWGQKYGVFYMGRPNLERKLEWIGEKTLDLVQLPGELQVFWDKSGSVSGGIGVAFAVLAGVGLISLVTEKRWVPLTLWVVPWLLAVAANWTGYWPYGVFRTNVFLIPYALCLTVAGLSRLESLVVRGRSMRREVRVGAALCAVLCLPYDLHYFSYKDVKTGAFASSIGASLQTIASYEAHSKGRVPLYLDGYACGTMRYYSTLHPTYKNLRSFVAQRVTVRCADNSVAKLEKLMLKSRKDDLWVITARPLAADPIRDIMTRRCERLDVAPVLPTADTLFHCRLSPRSRAD